MANGLTHFDKEGNAVMVDVSGKSITYRTALATGYISVGPEIMTCVTEGNVKKGDVLGVARVAGIMGVTKTSELEALTGVQVTLLTIYDMCKAIDKHMVMSEIHLVEKTGGKSGDFRFEDET